MEKKIQKDLAEKRKAAIAKRRADVPSKYRRTYDKAVRGKSLRAVVNAQCLECVCWQRSEVQACTCLACPLWGVRPYQEISRSVLNEPLARVESTNSPVPLPG